MSAKVSIHLISAEKRVNIAQAKFYVLAQIGSLATWDSILYVLGLANKHEN
jgi:hypothetical protein